MQLLSNSALIKSPNTIDIEAKEAKLQGTEKSIVDSKKQAIVNSLGTAELKGKEGNRYTQKAEDHPSSPEEQIGLAVVHFRPLNSWCGEFGFDWFREGDKCFNLKYEGAYEDTIDSGYKAGEGNLSTEEAVTNFKGEYQNLTIKRGSNDSGTTEYFVPYLSIFSKEFIDEILPKKEYKLKVLPTYEVMLQVGIEILEDIEKLEFVYDKDNLHIDEINCNGEKSALKKIGNIKITCKYDLTSDTYVNVYAYPKGDNSIASRRLAGRLLILQNDVRRRREEKIVLVPIEMKIAKNAKQKSAEIDFEEFYPIYNSLYQALIIPIVKEEKLDLKTYTKFQVGGEHISSDKLIKYYIPEKDEYSKSLFLDIKGYFNETKDKDEILMKDKYKDFFTVFVFPIASNDRTVGGITQNIGTKNSIVFTLDITKVLNSSGKYSTIAHEVLHGLGLPHTQNDKIGGEIDRFNQKYTYLPSLLTKEVTNIMHYGENGFEYSLHYWQWNIINKNIPKIKKKITNEKNNSN